MTGRGLRAAAAMLGAIAVVLGAGGAAAADVSEVRLDWAYYNPVSLVLRDKGLMEQEFAKDGIKVSWVLSLGSNKALEFLNANSIDFGSTAGAAALLAKANGAPIKGIYIYAKPEWTALVALKDSPLKTIDDLKGKSIAVTRGTDPHIFLLRALASRGLKSQDVKMVLLQHPEGRVAMERGDVDAWAGLDPYMAETELEKGSRLFYRNPDFNSWGFLNVREDFAKAHPETVERVLSVYETTRKWSIAHPDELKAVLMKASKISDSVAAKQLERNDLSSGMIGKVQRDNITAAGDVLKQAGVVPADADMAKTADELVDPQYITRVVARQAAK